MRHSCAVPTVCCRLCRPVWHIGTCKDGKGLYGKGGAPAALGNGNVFLPLASCILWVVGGNCAFRMHTQTQGVGNMLFSILFWQGSPRICATPYPERPSAPALHTGMTAARGPREACMCQLAAQPASSLHQVGQHAADARRRVQGDHHQQQCSTPRCKTHAVCVLVHTVCIRLLLLLAQVECACMSLGANQPNQALRPVWHTGTCCRRWLSTWQEGCACRAQSGCVFWSGRGSCLRSCVCCRFALHLQGIWLKFVHCVECGRRSDTRVFAWEQVCGLLRWTEFHLLQDALHTHV